MITRKRTIGLLLIVGLLTVGIASVYAKGGNPFDKFETVLDDLANMWIRIEGLQAQVAELQLEVAALETGAGLGAPDYDTGWVTPTGHSEPLLDMDVNMETDDVLVYMVGRYEYDDESNVYAVHQQYYGTLGTLWMDTPHEGAYWYMTPKLIDGQYWDPSRTELFVIRMDLAAGGMKWEEVRVMVWQLPPP